jgi:hypothetical protein
VTACLQINIVWDELLMMLLQKTEKKKEKRKTKHPYVLTYIASTQDTSGYYTYWAGFMEHSIYTLTLNLHLAIVVNAVGTRVMLQFFPPQPALCLAFFSLTIFCTHKGLGEVCSVCGGHLISMNFSPRNWEGYYLYS